MLCDAFAPGLQVMYASRGFLETSGCGAAGCIGKRHGDIFRGMAASSRAAGGSAGMPGVEVPRGCGQLGRRWD